MELRSIVPIILSHSALAITAAATFSPEWLTSNTLNLGITHPCILEKCLSGFYFLLYLMIVSCLFLLFGGITCMAGEVRQSVKMLRCSGALQLSGGGFCVVAVVHSAIAYEAVKNQFGSATSIWFGYSYFLACVGGFAALVAGIANCSKSQSLGQPSPSRIVLLPK